MQKLDLAVKTLIEEKKLSGDGKLLFDSAGNFYQAGSKSTVESWDGKAAEFEKGALLEKVDGFYSHPYGRYNEDTGDPGAEKNTGLGALEYQHKETEELGFKHTEFYVTESGFNIQGHEQGENVTNEKAQAEQLKQ